MTDPIKYFVDDVRVILFHYPLHWLSNFYSKAVELLSKNRNTYIFILFNDVT